jgi:regulator of RNase E activity RraA
MRELGFPCYATAIVPRGPHKGFGGVLDGLISCGGCPVRPGDIVLGDDDGIAIVPLERQAELLTASHAKLEQEIGWVNAINEGTLMADVLGLPQPDKIG